MRAPFTLALGVAVSLVIPFVVVSARADPAYSANKVIDFFTKQKAADAALTAKLVVFASAPRLTVINREPNQPLLCKRVSICSSISSSIPTS